MKRILIIRHAKSSWDYPELSDFERPLNKRGKRDLPDMSHRLRNQNFTIDLFLSSPAKRAMATAIGHASAYEVQASQIVQDKRLYHASSREIQNIIAETKNSIQSLAIFGHNPGLTDLINDLSHFDLWNLPTCGICVIDLAIDSWSESLNKKGRKVYYDYPKSTRTSFE